MSKVYIGNVTSEGDRLIHRYLDKFMPDAVVEPLKASGIKSRLKSASKRPDVACIIIDEPLYQQCVGTIDDILALPKVHKYTNDNGLREFLISKFGILDDEPVKEEQVVKEEPIEISVPAKEVQEIKGIENTTKVEAMPVFTDSSDTDVDFGFTGALGGMSSITSSDEEVEKLSKELEQSKMLVKNLTRQLQAAGDDSDVVVLVKRIKELEDTIKERDSRISELENDSYVTAGKIAKAEEAITKLRTTESELKHQRELNAEASYLKTELERKINESNDKIVSLESYKSKYQDTQEQLDKLKDEYKVVYANYESKCDEYNVLLTRAENAEKGSTDVHKQVKELTVKLTDLQSQLEKKARALSSLEQTSKSDKQSIESLTEQIKVLTKSLSDEKSKAGKLSNDLVKVNARVSSLEKDLKDANEELDLALKENTELSNNLKAKEEELKGVSDELSSSKGSIEQYKAQVQSLEVYVDDLKKKSKDVAELMEKVDNLTKELDTSKATVTVRDSKIVELESVLKAREDDLESLNARLKTMSSSVSDGQALKSQVESLTTQLEAVKNQLADKREELIKLSEAKETVELSIESTKLRLESTISDKDREIKNLESEIELLKRGEDKEGKTAELRLKILDLQEENQQLKLKQDNNNVEEILKLKEELASVKMRSVDLEMELAERDEREKEVQSSIFTTMSNCALPKLTIDARVPVPDIEMPKCHVVASGSAESNMSLYKTIKNTCIANQGKKIIIVDLSPDSYIDAEFRMQRVPSPLNWLMGTEAISNFVADTYLGNVKVISSSLVYTNPLYFLSVNWVLRLQELNTLSKHADILIINVGTLNDIVTKILFQSFASIMKSHVVLRATPVNIRTAFLSFAGVKNMDKAEIACVNFDNASKKMYQKLASKYSKSRILRDTEGLGV